ncbi:hypothetical protein H4R18_001635 [Coemansia javaensis]|uniref:Uncharacterized protein n=1 Tax=Coemansia javaensis TaxID=2761396 RepID=A0A9W8LKC5_9FUNG|nr:hypothetical protein H4R18_001635 [Coemansia javaensis]
MQMHVFATMALAAAAAAGSAAKAAAEAGETWLRPECLETGRGLEFRYGHDGPVQCSIKGGSAFHRAMVHSAALKAPLRCRVARLEFALRVEGVAARGSRGSDAAQRINGNFNAALHAQKGTLVAAGVYPVADWPLPEAVGGITTLQFSQRWYEGSSLAVLMANRRSEEEFIIQPVVAAMFCVLTACAVYVVGRVYVEGSLIPRVLAEHGIPAAAAAASTAAAPSPSALKKTN